MAPRRKPASAATSSSIQFISGLPRSGSTLLSALLLQNPALHAGITSGVGSLVGAMLREVSQGRETAVMIDDGQREALLRGVFTSYYHAILPTRTVFDTSRGWTTRLALLSSLFPRSKVICCVREMPWIIDSIERLVRANRWELSKIFDFDPGGTVYSRADGLASRNGMLGFAYNALKQAVHSEQSDMLMLLSYETLVSEPARALQAVYEFTGMPPFAHDFNAARLDATQFDAQLGTSGLHTVRPRVEKVERETILPPDLWRRFAGENFWLDATFNSRDVRLV